MDPRITAAAYAACAATGAIYPELLVPQLEVRLGIHDGKVVAVNDQGEPRFKKHGLPVSATELAIELRGDPDISLCWRGGPR